jgi:hypothetical protein
MVKRPVFAGGGIRETAIEKARYVSLFDSQASGAKQKKRAT